MIKTIINALRGRTGDESPAPRSVATRDLSGPAQSRAMALVEQGQRDSRQLNREAWYRQYRAGA